MDIKPAAQIFTRDVALVESFLREVLGFTGWTKTVGTDGQPGVVILEREGFEITVSCALNVSRDPIQRATVTFIVEDLEPLAEALDARGVKYH
jgi:hypothetical protein